MERYIKALQEESYDPYIVEKLSGAIQRIVEGSCKRVDVSEDIKVYECKDIVRIDIKMRKD